VNGGRLSTDITIFVPDPVHLTDLPSSTYACYDFHYQDLKTALVDLAAQWSVNIKFV